MATLWFPTHRDADARPADSAKDSTPIHLVVDSGLRPVIRATVNRLEVSMLVHANAGFLAMLTHDTLYRVTGQRVQKEQEFGLGHDLRPSSAGRGHTEIRSLTVAGHTMTRVPLEVFDLPTTNWDGMLGVDWLADTGAVVDFGGSVVRVPREGTVRPEVVGARLVVLDRDLGTGRWTCRLSIDAGSDDPGRFVVSTVAETTLDVGFAAAHGIDLGDPVDEEHGPTGAVVPVYRPAQPVTLASGGSPLTSVTPAIYDIYAYGDTRRPTSSPCLAGYLGADVLVAAGATIDFASASAG